jgi:hypothetical protein
MDRPRFAIGVAGPKKKKRAKMRNSTDTFCLGPVIFRKWFILPAPSCVIGLIVNCIGGSLTEAKARIREISLDIKRTDPTSWGSYRLLGITEQHLKYIFYMCHMNERLRRILNKASIRWRKNHLIKANEEDLITMDSPVRPVNLYDWKQKRIYTFEAATIFRCLTKRLTTHDGMFATPLHPVNPYTNMMLTVGQMHSVTQQLKSYGLTHWAIEAVRNARYCWTEFMILNESALQMAAMRSVFSDSTNTELHETLLDFIDAEYTNNRLTIDRDMYRWLLQNAIGVDHLSKWRALCYEFYRNHILYKETPIKQKLSALKIAAIAADLCRMPRELYVMRNRFEATINGEA